MAITMCVEGGEGRFSCPEMQQSGMHGNNSLVSIYSTSPPVLQPSHTRSSGACVLLSMLTPSGLAERGQ